LGCLFFVKLFENLDGRSVDLKIGYWKLFEDRAKEALHFAEEGGWRAGRWSLGLRSGNLRSGSGGSFGDGRQFGGGVLFLDLRFLRLARWRDHERRRSLRGTTGSELGYLSADFGRQVGGAEDKRCIDYNLGLPGY
jgi:hypothetical protein